MKTIFIPFDQAFKDPIIDILNKNQVRGFTFWDEIQGRGTKDGEPHYGSHAWPSLNSAIVTIVPDEKVKPILQDLKLLDDSTKLLGLHAYVWNIEEMI